MCDKVVIHHAITYKNIKLTVLRGSSLSKIIDEYIMWDKVVVHHVEVASDADLIRPSIYDTHSGSMQIAIHLEHKSHCKTASSKKW